MQNQRQTGDVPLNIYLTNNPASPGESRFIADREGRRWRSLRTRDLVEYGRAAPLDERPTQTVHVCVRVYVEKRKSYVAHTWT